MSKLICFYFLTHIILTNGGNYIENFNTVKEISSWYEHSDTVRDVGKSKGNLVLLKTEKFQHAVFFTLLNPQPCGAAFAGVTKQINLDLSSFQNILIRVRGQGAYNSYKLILKENQHKYSFCNFFKVDGNFSEIVLPLSNFKPYFEGKLINDTNVKLDLSKIVSVGIQAYGGVYLPVKQSGVASLEIDWIKYT